MGEELLEEDYLDGDAEKDQYMTFKTGTECFGIPLTNVNEIISIQTITPVPDVDSCVRGLINLRGKIIPVVDVRMRFRMEPLPYTDRTCIIIVFVKDMSVGLIVEEIEEVVRIEQDNIVVPSTLGKTDDIVSSYISGLARTENGVKLLLETEKLLLDEDFETFGEMAGA